MALQATAPSSLRVTMAHQAECDGRYAGRVVGIRASGSWTSGIS